MSSGLTVGAYWPLALLLVIPYVWWIRRRTWTVGAVYDRPRCMLAVVRSGIIALLALALMEPAIQRSAAPISVAYLLDVSQSVAPADIQSAIQWIRRTNDSGRPDHARYIPFGENARVFDSLDRLEAVGVAEGPSDDAGDAIHQNATNIEVAVDNALQNFAPHHLKRLVLITDGNENQGRVLNMVRRLQSENVRVYTMPLEARLSRDVSIESIETSPEVAAQEPFSVEVDVHSRIQTSAHVELRHGETTLGSREVPLVAGLNRIPFETSLKDESGSVMLEAEVRSPDDRFAGNNRFRKSIVVHGKPAVLYVEGHPQSARYFEAALRVEGFAVTTLPAAAVPDSARELDGYDVLVLSDVARSSLNEQQMRALATYVRDLGGGFILAAGDTSNGGDGGYSRTEIERILPITFDAKRPHRSVAMIIVLDKSGSMGGPDFAFTKEAARAPLQLLADTDRFGVVAFDSEFFWAVPLENVDNAEKRAQMGQAISAIVPGGETDIYPALDAAYAQLANDSSEIKHVILLSDGHTGRDPFQSLVEKMAQARITVSTVALGAAADRDLLAKIAGWGKGRTYYVTDASHVPQVFTYEAELTTGSTLRESPFTPVVKKKAQVLKGIDFETAPDLLGYAVTKAKEKSEVLLESPREDPLLVRWQYGLGRTAAFTSDLKDRWAVNWLRWNGYSKFWSQLVRETVRPRDNSELNLSVVRDGDHARITADAIQKDGKFLNNGEFQLSVVQPDQSISNVPLHQVGPGSYEVQFLLKQGGSYVFRVTGEKAGASRTLGYSYPDEYHLHEPNVDLLRTISDETKGKFQPAAQDIFATNGENVIFPVPLWPYLAVAALLLYIADVFLRRVAKLVN